MSHWYRKVYIYEYDIRVTLPPNGYSPRNLMERAQWRFRIPDLHRQDNQITTILSSGKFQLPNLHPIEHRGLRAFQQKATHRETNSHPRTSKREMTADPLPLKKHELCRRRLREGPASTSLGCNQHSTVLGTVLPCCIYILVDTVPQDPRVPGTVLFILYIQ